MTGSDLVRYDRQLSLSPITLGLTSVFGPVGMVYAQNGTAFASDVIARLLWMILERLLRSIHSAASQYLQQWKQLKEEGIRERLESAFKGKSHADDMPSKPSVTEAVHEHISTKGWHWKNPDHASLNCPMQDVRSGRRPELPTHFLERWTRWTTWRNDMMAGTHFYERD